MNNVLYNSFENDKKLLSKKVFQLESDDQLTQVETEIFPSENLIIIDKKEYIQFDLYYNKSDLTLSKKIENIKSLLIDEKSMKKYNEYKNYNSVYFYLNENDLDFAVVIKDISSFNVLDINDFIIITIISPLKTTYIDVDQMISRQFNNIGIFFERTTLNNTEKEFIINNF